MPINRRLLFSVILGLALIAVFVGQSEINQPRVLGAGPDGALCANAPGAGSAVCPGTTATTVYNPTHYKQQVGTTATYQIMGATDASTSNAPCSSTGQVNVIIKSTPLGNTTVCGTLSGTTITFSFTAPANGCMTTNVAYNSNGNGATNDIISDGINNNTPTAAAGIGYVDASGNPINTCSTVKKDPSVVTELHTASEGVIPVGTGTVALGSTVHDKAIVTGDGVTTPTGTVTFTFYSTGDCTLTGAAAGSVALVAGIAHPSNSQGPLAAGSYSFSASYSGDSNYNAKDSECEPFTVNKANLDVTTDIHNSSHGSVGGAVHVPLGSVVHDTASVTGGVSGFAIPAVSFKFFTGTLACDNTGVDVALGTPGTGADAIRTVDSTALAAGQYSYQATVASNDNYVGKTSPCEPLTVDKANLDVTTDIHNRTHGSVGGAVHVPLGSVVHDTASVTGGVSGFAIPAVSFKFFTGTLACDNTGANVALGTPGTGADAIRTVDSVALAAGSYAYQATVASNDNYVGKTSPCEPLTVDKANLDVTTDIHNSSHGPVGGAVHVPLGSVVHDTASVTGGVSGFAIPAVSFKFFTGTLACDNTGANVALGTAGTGADAIRTIDSAALAAGSYAYQATVASDDNYIGKTSPCEPLTVDKANLDVTTDIHDASHGSVGGAVTVPLGSVVHDTASVTGGVSGFAIPTVSFKFFMGTLACDNTGVDVALGTPGAGADAIRTVDSAALGAGSYAYQATVASNDNYNGKTSPCEPLTVDKAQLSVTTDIHNASHQSVTSADAGSTLHDTASVTGGVTGFTLPAVSFNFFTGGDCTTGTISALATNGTEGSAVKSADKGPLSSGFYAFRASVAGNDNYIGATSDCEPFVIRTFGKTQGFWGNRNGQARIGNYATNFVELGISGQRYVKVDTKDESLKILPSTHDACGKGNPIIFGTANANCTLSSDLKEGPLDNLASQTLALSYNIKLVTGYSGQSVALLGCTGSLTAVLTGAPLNLSGTSTVNQVLTVANSLIAQSASGGATTQAQAGAMNDLLGCLNRETP